MLKRSCCICCQLYLNAIASLHSGRLGLHCHLFHVFVVANLFRPVASCSWVGRAALRGCSTQPQSLPLQPGLQSSPWCLRPSTAHCSSSNFSAGPACQHHIFSLLLKHPTAVFAATARLAELAVALAALNGPLLLFKAFSRTSMPASTCQSVVEAYTTARLAEIAVLLVALHGLLLLLTDCCTQSMPMSDSVSDIGHAQE